MMATDAAVPPTLIRSPGRFWATRLCFGILLSVVIVSLEFAYYYPLVSVRRELGLDSVLSSLMTWSGECILLALALGALDYWLNPREPRAWELALTVAVGAFCGALVWNLFAEFVLRDQMGLRLFVDHVNQPVAWLGRAFYHGWLLFFFGGLATAVVASLRQRTRMLAALRAAELARATSQQRLTALTLGSLRARVDPKFVFETLSRVETLYETDPSEADRQLQELIAFLRSALADIHASSAIFTSDQSLERRETLPVT